ncbi:hypothetical protein AGMMS50289_00770 [Betaproteobacteria bacterium]|nr:hypothetical protein AGMMS50289_00770 [Betaproteobacteria bacterium]
MYRTLLIIITTCLFASGADAQISLEEQVWMDSVSSVKLDGVELAKPVNIQTLPKVFWKGGVTQEIWWAGCTANGEVYLDYKNKNVKLEFFPEENEGIGFEKIFDKKIGYYKNYPLHARVWVKWGDIQGFTESLKLDQHQIKADLSFDEFKKMFPVSAERGHEFNKDDPERIPDAHRYFVAIGKYDPGDDAPPYMSTVNFLFKDGKLIALEIFQGIAC